MSLIYELLNPELKRKLENNAAFEAQLLQELKATQQFAPLREVLSEQRKEVEEIANRLEEGDDEPADKEKLTIIKAEVAQMGTLLAAVDEKSKEIDQRLGQLASTDTTLKSQLATHEMTASQALAPAIGNPQVRETFQNLTNARANPLTVQEALKSSVAQASSAPDVNPNLPTPELAANFSALGLQLLLRSAARMHGLSFKDSLDTANQVFEKHSDAINGLKNNIRNDMTQLESNHNERLGLQDNLKTLQGVLAESSQKGVNLNQLISRVAGITLTPGGSKKAEEEEEQQATRSYIPRMVPPGTPKS